MIKDYYTLTKPGILYGNALTVVAGFFLASTSEVDIKLLTLVLIGLTLIIASGCVFNNYIDRDIDALMERTKKRALVRGVIPGTHALLFGVGIGVLGILILVLFTNPLTVATSLVGLFVYVVVYSMWLKRSSVHSALIGGISGAVPPVVGYFAVSNSIDMGAVLLFIILALWQLPHSFAIALYRLDDYTRAHIPVVPRVRGVKQTKVQIFFYTILFVVATLLLYVYEYTEWLYALCMTILGLVWVWIAATGFYTNDKEVKTWAKRLFGFSIITLLVWCIVIVVEHFIM